MAHNELLADWLKDAYSMEKALIPVLKNHADDAGDDQALSSEPFDDELIKNFISDYATEQFEIASYKSLIAAARASGEEEIARTCEEILADEEAMARRLDEHMASAARESLAED